MRWITCKVGAGMFHEVLLQELLNFPRYLLQKAEFIHCKQKQLHELVYLRHTPSESWFHWPPLLIEIQHHQKLVGFALWVLQGLKQDSVHSFYNSNKCRAWNYFLGWIYRVLLIPGVCWSLFLIPKDSLIPFLHGNVPKARGSARFCSNTVRKNKN